MYFFPKLYIDNSGYLDSTVLFVRVGKKELQVGAGIQWQFRVVKKVAPGIYRGIKKPFFDFKAMFTEVL